MSRRGLSSAARRASSGVRAGVEEVPDSYTYVCEDQPERTAELVGEFAARAAEGAEAAR